MTENFCTVGEIRLCYESFGDPADPTMLLLTGLGGQLVHWPAEFCAALASRGFHVVRFDHRDAGRSSTLDSNPPPPRTRLLRRSGRGAPYSLDDMADDAVGLLDHLGVGAAHIVGMSLGAIVGQSLAVRHPDRVLSLVSIAGNTGRRQDHPSLPILAGMMLRPPADRERYVRRTVRALKMFGSPGFQTDEAVLRRLAGTAFARGVHPEGTWRQLAAILVAGDRSRRLRAITAPTLVIHGDADRVLPTSGGKATADAIPGAELVVIPGMGHELPVGVWPRVIDEIVANAERG